MRVYSRNDTTFVVITQPHLCHIEGEGEGVAEGKKISAEELFESVCSLKAAGAQMQLQDGE